MQTIIYRKSDLICVGTVADNMTIEQEIELNVIPNFGGVDNDYGFIETDKENFHLEKDESENVIIIDNIVKPIVVEDKPTQSQIEFAEYVLATEDRIAQLESKIGGTV